MKHAGFSSELFKFGKAGSNFQLIVSKRNLKAENECDRDVILCRGMPCYNTGPVGLAFCIKHMFSSVAKSYGRKSNAFAIVLTNP